MNMIGFAIDFQRSATNLFRGLLKRGLYFFKDFGSHDFASIFCRENKMHAEFCNTVPSPIKSFKHADRQTLNTRIIAYYTGNSRLDR